MHLARAQHVLVSLCAKCSHSLTLQVEISLDEARALAAKLGLPVPPPESDDDGSALTQPGPAAPRGNSPSFRRWPNWIELVPRAREVVPQRGGEREVRDAPMRIR